MTENRFLRNIDRVKDIAYFTLFEKYIIQDLKGHKKRVEIESTDQESIVVGLNGGFPIPGIVYTFVHGGKDVALETKKKTYEYSDLVPIMFCMNTGHDFFTGINMNMLPPDVRLDFLEAFYQTFKKFFIDLERLTQNDKLAINREFVELMKSGGGQKMVKTFNSKMNQNFNFAYRKYKVKKVKKLRMVEYQEHKYIPFVDPKDAFRKIGFKRIHELYHRSN